MEESLNGSMMGRERPGEEYREEDSEVEITHEEPQRSMEKAPNREVTQYFWRSWQGPPSKGAEGKWSEDKWSDSKEGSTLMDKKMVVITSKVQ